MTVLLRNWTLGMLQEKGSFQPKNSCFSKIINWVKLPFRQFEIEAEENSDELWAGKSTTETKNLAICQSVEGDRKHLIEQVGSYKQASWLTSSLRGYVNGRKIKFLFQKENWNIFNAARFCWKRREKRRVQKYKLFIRGSWTFPVLLSMSYTWTSS